MQAAIRAEGPATAPARLDSLTGLRFLAASAVFGFHLVLIFPGARFGGLDHVFGAGPSAVSFFFLLSGFVLTWSHRAGDGVRAFWQRRLARIYPMQVATWLASLALLVAVLHRPPGAGPATASLLLLSPWVPQLRYYNAMDVACWSLGCELFFYLLFPLVIRLVERLDQHQRRAALLGALAVVVGVAAGLHGARPDTTAYWFVYYFPPVRFFEFLGGMLLAREVAEGTWPRLAVAPLAVLALAAYVGASWAPPTFLVAAVTVVPYALLLAAVAQRDAAGHASVLASRPMVRLGLWSYALYLIHVPLLELFAHLEPVHLGLAASVATALGTFVATVALSAVAFTAVERPSEKRLRPGGRMSVTTVGA